MSKEYELDDVTVEQTSNLMAQIQQHVKKLKDLKWKMLEAEEEFKRCEQEYTEFARNVMPDLFKMNGLDTLTTDDGHKVQVVTKTQCSINKNDEDRSNVAKWLRAHGGTELVKSEFIVPVSQREKLMNSGITYEEETTMNTNQVKAFLLDQLGQKGNPAMITKEDLPKGLHFFQFDEVEVV